MTQALEHERGAFNSGNRKPRTGLKATAGFLTLGMWFGLQFFTGISEAKNAPYDNLRRIENCIDHNTEQLAGSSEITSQDVVVASDFCFGLFEGAQIPGESPQQDIIIRKIQEFTGVVVVPVGEVTD